MEIIDKKSGEKPTKSSSLRKGTSENLAETLKSERVRLRKALGDMFANECYRRKYIYTPKMYEDDVLTPFFSYGKEDIDFDKRPHYGPWGSIWLISTLQEKFRRSYKHHNGKLYRLNLKLSEDEVDRVTNKFIMDLYHSWKDKLEDGTREKYIEYKAALYGAEQKKNEKAIEDLEVIEGVRKRKIKRLPL